MGWVINATTLLLHSRRETHYPFYRRLGEPRGRFGRVRKISPSPGFDNHTVQPVTSRYTDYVVGILDILCKSGIRLCSGALSDTWNTSEVHRRMQYT